MVLREDRIGQQLLIPLDLRDLIPKDHPCYFIQNVVDQMDFSKVDAIIVTKQASLLILVKCY